MSLKMYSEPSPLEHPLKRIKYIIAVAAGKGGVGKSTVTVNLALALQKLGYQVGVMDTDVYGPSVRKMMPEQELPQQKGEWISPANCCGIRMISMAYFRRDHEATAVRAPIANGMIKQFISQVQWGELDFLLIDFPPGTGDVQLTLSQQVPLTGAIMVTTPQEVAVLDVRKAISLFQQVHVPLIGIVENMSYYEHPQTKEALYLFGQGGGDKLAQETGTSLLGRIPIDPILSLSGDKGMSIFAPDWEASQAVANIFLGLASRVRENVAILKGEQAGCLSSFELVWKEMSC